MKVIGYRKEGLEGIGIMVDEVNCVSLGASMPDLPTTLMGLLNFEGGMEVAKSTIQTSFSIVFTNLPIPEISTSVMSPSFIHICGSRRDLTPSFR